MVVEAVCGREVELNYDGGEIFTQLPILSLRCSGRVYS